MKIKGQTHGDYFMRSIRWFMFKIVWPVEDYFFIKMLDRIHPGHDVE